jgi:uncharacterized tellurite resistance protein B-like protein
LKLKGESAFLTDLAQGLEGHFKRDAVLLAVEVMGADGFEAPAEREALERLKRAFDLDDTR